MWNPDGCHSRINVHWIEATPQNLVSHLVATDGSLFLFGFYVSIDCECNGGNTKKYADNTTNVSSK